MYYLGTDGVHSGWTGLTGFCPASMHLLRESHVMSRMISTSLHASLHGEADSNDRRQNDHSQNAQIKGT